ncbi:MAG: TonB-dependent receptor plug domain-containing protein [Bacteroidales bacterium]|nr:TonB-dependent receptor plug domain-containing protein [Bacteroidales bacterium]
MSVAKRVKYCAILLAVCWLFLGSADEDNRLTRLRETFWKYMVKYPQQKAYLHLDRPYYYAGEIIWFKAYLVDGMYHRPDSFSTNLYVELIAPDGTQAQIIRLRMAYGFGIGDFSLSDTLPEGLYQIRAYTNWMQNFHPDFFFSKNLQVFNPDYTKLISPQQAKRNLKDVDKHKAVYMDLDVQFLPEGGNLINGIESVVAFKAINKSGNGVDIQGNVYDSDKSHVAEIHTRYDGMGSFRLTPQKGKKYYAIITNVNREYRFNLPNQLEYGVGIHIDNKSHEIGLHISDSRPPTNDRVANEVIVIGQVRGRIYYQSVLNLIDGPVSVSVNKRIFPSGIVQFMVFSGRMVPLAERLVFVSNNDLMRINVSAYDTITDNDERLICFYLNTMNRALKPVKSNLSMVVLYDNEEQMIVSDNIVSNMLLVSDLRGYIKNPIHYIQSAMAGNSEAIELLMMIHGWRKFEWSEILGNNWHKVKYLEEKGITITGLITTEFFGIPLKKCKVQLSVAEAYNDIFTQLSNDQGIFKFENLFYYDTINIKIEAWKPSGRRGLVIFVPEDTYAKVTKQQGDYTLTTLSERDNKAYRRERYRKERIAYEEEQRRKAIADSNKLQGIYGDPDAVIRSEDFPSGYRDALQVLQGRIPGVAVSGNNVIIRGVNTIYGSTQPLYLIDGIPVSDVSSVLGIPVEDIDRIEVLKGPSCAIYGSRGGNGVIAIYTKRGSFMKKGIIEFQMLGYHWPRKFYQPAFDPDVKPNDIETISWNPFIETDAAGKARVIIKKPAIEGKIRIVIEGISNEGQTGYTNVILENN